MDTGSQQFKTVIAELKLIFSKLLLCMMSMQKDVKTGTNYLNCKNTNSVLDVSDNIEHKLEILKGFLVSIQKLCKHLNQSCTDQSKVSQ